MQWSRLQHKSGKYLFEIIMRRYETRSTIMTSNGPIEEWAKPIGDVPSATAIKPTYNEMRDPKIIRLSMSRPNSSVPIQWAELGGLRIICASIVYPS